MHRPVLSRLAPGAQWALILPLSAGLVWVLHLANVPAELLLGPMAAGTLAGIKGATARVGDLAYETAQSLLGCMIAGTVTPAIMATFLNDWALFLAVVVVIILASVLIGWFLAWRQILPGSTGLWGTSPGAAPAMVVLADAHGADVRLVAFMQYLRVVCVALVATLVAGLWGDPGGTLRPEAGWLDPVQVPALAVSLGLVGLGVFVSRRFRLASAAMFVPMILGSALHASGLADIETPPWLLAASYALIGWRIGLGFTLDALRHALRLLPVILASTLGLIGFCGGLALLLVRVVGVEPLTAYLATSPGGIATVAIIAAEVRQVDVPFVMTLQTVRFCLVVLTGPPLARALAKVTGRSR